MPDVDCKELEEKMKEANRLTNKVKEQAREVMEESNTLHEDIWEAESESTKADAQAGFTGDEDREDAINRLQELGGELGGPTGPQQADDRLSRAERASAEADTNARLAEDSLAQTESEISEWTAEARYLQEQMDRHENDGEEDLSYGYWKDLYDDAVERLDGLRVEAGNRQAEVDARNTAADRAGDEELAAAAGSDAADQLQAEYDGLNARLDASYRKDNLEATFKEKTNELEKFEADNAVALYDLDQAYDAGSEARLEWAKHCINEPGF